MKTLIQIFARPPIAGEVKTRLIPDLGAKKACKMYQKMLFGTIESILESYDKSQVQLWVTYKDCNFESIININYGVEVVVQKGNNLGNKMLFALTQGLMTANKVLLLGTDCPSLTTKHYVKSECLLSKVKMVFIPAIDGGFVLVGASKIVPECFDGVNWGTETVMQQTQNRLNKKDYQLILPALHDLDNYKDYLWHQENQLF